MAAANVLLLTRFVEAVLRRERAAYIADLI